MCFLSSPTVHLHRNCLRQRTKRRWITVVESKKEPVFIQPFQLFRQRRLQRSLKGFPIYRNSTPWTSEIWLTCSKAQNIVLRTCRIFSSSHVTKINWTEQKQNYGNWILAQNLPRNWKYVISRHRKRSHGESASHAGRQQFLPSLIDPLWQWRRCIISKREWRHRFDAPTNGATFQYLIRDFRDRDLQRDADIWIRLSSLFQLSENTFIHTLATAGDTAWRFMFMKSFISPGTIDPL